jgi:hypothetical protein
VLCNELSSFAERAAAIIGPYFSPILKTKRLSLPRLSSESSTGGGAVAEVRLADLFCCYFTGRRVNSDLVKVQFSITQSDYDCLLKNIGHKSAHKSLSNASPKRPRGSIDQKLVWEVDCNSIDAIHILRTAHDFCPEAVADIREGIALYTSRSV